METVALGIFVFELTGSPFWVAVVGFLRMIPMLLLGPSIGLISDRVDRKLIMGTTLATLSGVYVVMAALVISGQIELWQICVGATLAGVMWATDFPVRRAMIGDAVGTDGISTAIGIDMASSNFSRVIGPLGAGAFLATLGVEAAYVTGAILFALASALAFSLPKVGPIPRTLEKTGYFANLAEGLRHVKADQIIVVTLIITIVMNIFGFPYQHMVPVIGAESLKIGPLLIGILLATEGMGATVGSLTIALKARPGGFTKIYSIGSVMALIAILAFSLVPSFWMALPILLIGGFSMSGFATMQSIIVITSTPAEIRGRVLGVLAASIGTGPLGALLVGGLAVWWGASNAVTAISVVGLTLTIVSLAIWPSFLRSSVRTLVSETSNASDTGVVGENE
jgi:MFS family permease